MQEGSQLYISMCHRYTSSWPESQFRGPLTYELHQPWRPSSGGGTETRAGPSRGWGSTFPALNSSQGAVLGPTDTDKSNRLAYILQGEGEGIGCYKRE